MTTEPVMLNRAHIVRAGVACVVRNRRGQFIMIRRTGAHGAGTWSVPGGWIGHGETPSQAAAREVWEEIGVVVTEPQSLLGCWTNDMFVDEGLHCLTLWLHAFIVEDGHEPSIHEPDKITEIQWVHEYGPYPRPLFLPVKNRIDQRGSVW